MKTLVFANIKGGIGKTTSSLNVASMLALQGYHVLMVDLDHQANLTDYLIETEDSIKDLLDDIYGIRPASEEIQIGTLLNDYNPDIEKFICRSNRENIDFIPASLNLAKDKLQFMNSGSPLRLKGLLKKVSSQYDYCIIDCAPSIDILFLSAVYAADEIYCPCRLDRASIKGFLIVRDSIRSLSLEMEHTPILKMFFGQVMSTTKVISRETFTFVQDHLQEFFIPIAISYDKTVGEGSYSQDLLIDQDHSMRRKATRQYAALVEYMIAEDKDAFIAHLYQDYFDPALSFQDNVRNVMSECHYLDL